MFLDEILLKKQQKYQAENHRLLEEGVCIDEQLIRFQRRDIDNFFAIMLPDIFKNMPQKVAEIKYPSVFRPQRIFTTKDLCTNIGFSVFPDNLETEGTENTIKRMIEALSKENPGYRFFDRKNLQKREGTWFAFQSHAMDSTLYNLMMITKINQGILQSNFNCLFTNQKDWKPVILQMWDSIEEVDKEKIG